MDFETATDCVRIICLLEIVLIFIFMRRETRGAGQWTRKGLQLFLFNIFLLIVVFFGFSEKIAQDAPPAWSPYFAAVALGFGAYAMGSKGGLNKPDKRD